MEYIIIGLLGIILVLLLILLLRPNKSNQEMNLLKQDLQQNTMNLGNLLSDTQKNNNEILNERLKEMSASVVKQNELNTYSNEALRKQLFQSIASLEDKMNTLTLQNEEKLEKMRLTVEQRVLALQEDNHKQLDEMRKTVDEKLQDTLEKRISQSFQLVSERLEQVYKGLGEMQTLANGVGDLKKVLSNVKTRGILGEIQLKAILEEILSPEQYEENVATRKGSANRVEFAVKLPGDEKCVYLPIDSKFPGDKYANVVDAYEMGDTEKIAKALKELDDVIKKEAKDIRDKYIDVPNTTDFAIMFLPFEGLYAEVVRRGLVEVLQRDYKINVAGPTTMAALLNSLQMGFKTLAIQKRSSEVWDILGAVKSEFSKFASALEITQDRLEKAQHDLENLVGVRTRQMQRKLDKVSELEPEKAKQMIDE